MSLQQLRARLVVLVVGIDIGVERTSVNNDGYGVTSLPKISSIRSEMSCRPLLPAARGPDAPDAATALLESGGASIINSDRAVGRRRLALAHEFGHYLLADEYTVDWRIGFSTSSQRTEWLIDVFARALLLPAESLGKRWSELTARQSVREVAVRVASEYRVDMATLAARLSDLSLAGPEDLSVVRATRTTRSDIIEHDLW